LHFFPETLWERVFSKKRWKCENKKLSWTKKLIKFMKIFQIKDNQ
jgi:hypothetical protein